jgi:transcriptional regulator with XRE-family HTH domain
MPRDHRLDFGIFVGIRREQLRFNGTEVGAACGTTQSAISNWERCKAFPDTELQVRRLATKLQLNADELVAIWERTCEDVAYKGFAIVTRAYDVLGHSGGGKPHEPYDRTKKKPKKKPPKKKPP